MGDSLLKASRSFPPLCAFLQQAFKFFLYFGFSHPYGEWKDTGIRLEGDAVRSLTITFLEMWNAIKKNLPSDRSFEPYLPDEPYKAVQHGYVQPYADSPLDDEQVVLAGNPDVLVCTPWSNK